jgi:hypothetical protein
MVFFIIIFVLQKRKLPTVYKVKLQYTVGSDYVA